MRLAMLFVAAAGLIAGAPALATSTIQCSVPGRADLQLFLSVSNSAAAGIAHARLVDGQQETLTGHGAGQARITQNWVDPLELKLDVADANIENLIARLVARRSVDRGPYLGTLTYREQRMNISCLWDEDEG